MKNLYNLSPRSLPSLYNTLNSCEVLSPIIISLTISCSSSLGFLSLSFFLRVYSLYHPLKIFNLCEPISSAIILKLSVLVTIDVKPFRIRCFPFIGKILPWYLLVKLSIWIPLLSAFSTFENITIGNESMSNTGCRFMHFWGSGIILYMKSCYWVNWSIIDIKVVASTAILISSNY